MKATAYRHQVIDRYPGPTRGQRPQKQLSWTRVGVSRTSPLSGVQMGNPGLTHRPVQQRNLSSVRCNRLLTSSISPTRTHPVSRSCRTTAPEARKAAAARTSPCSGKRCHTAMKIRGRAPLSPLKKTTEYELVPLADPGGDLTSELSLLPRQGRPPSDFYYNLYCSMVGLIPHQQEVWLIPH